MIVPCKVDQVSGLQVSAWEMQSKIFTFGRVEASDLLYPLSEKLRKKIGLSKCDRFLHISAHSKFRHEVVKTGDMLCSCGIW